MYYVTVYYTNGLKQSAFSRGLVKLLECLYKKEIPFNWYNSGDGVGKISGFMIERK